MEFLHEYDIKFIDGRVDRFSLVVFNASSEEEAVKYIKGKEKKDVFHTKRLFELREIEIGEM
ncbi:MAG: hypothetical protein WC587_02480 [Candidatus Paceibacterota bacterium]